MLAAVATLGSACGAGDPGPLEGGPELVLPTHPDWDDGPAALVGGNVEFDEATGCIYLVTDGYRSVPVWPPGTRATRDPFRVVLEDGREIEEGDYVEGGGGEYGFDVDAMEHCLGDGVGPSMLNWDDDIAIDESGRRIIHPAPSAMVPFQPSVKPLNGMTSSIEGTVELQVETGCSLLVAGGKRDAVVWPRGTRGELDPYRLTLEDGTVIHDGDTIRGKGDVFSPDDLIAVDGFPECLFDAVNGDELSEAWAFNHDGAIEVVER